MSVVPLDNMSLSTKARRRMRTSREEIAILESYYVKNSNPNHDQKQEIANVVKMGPKNVHFWFQNRRAKDNKKRKLLHLRQQKIAQQQQHQNTDDNKDHVQQQISLYHQQQQQQQLQQFKNTYNLPPISSIMGPNANNISISYFFHHSKFGIKDCMLQMQQTHNSTEY